MRVSTQKGSTIALDIPLNAVRLHWYSTNNMTPMGSKRFDFRQLDITRSHLAARLHISATMTDIPTPCQEIRLTRQIACCGSPPLQRTPLRSRHTWGCKATPTDTPRCLCTLYRSRCSRINAVRSMPNFALSSHRNHTTITDLHHPSTCSSHHSRTSLHYSMSLLHPSLWYHCRPAQCLSLFARLYDNRI